MTVERLREVLDYSPQTGVFTWRIRRNWAVLPGTVAGRLNRDGHRKIDIDGVVYFAHRLAWLVTYGRWPGGQIDHANGNPDDNAIGNLREATNRENSRNRRVDRESITGLKGVYHRQRKNGYQARIFVDGKRVTVGSYASAEEAARAYDASALQHFGEFARLNFPREQLQSVEDKNFAIDPASEDCRRSLELAMDVALRNICHPDEDVAMRATTLLFAAIDERASL